VADSRSAWKSCYAAGEKSVALEGFLLCGQSFHPISLPRCNMNFAESILNRSYSQPLF
jgi:hypothetical protein